MVAVAAQVRQHWGREALALEMGQIPVIVPQMRLQIMAEAAVGVIEEPIHGFLAMAVQELSNYDFPQQQELLLLARV